METEMYNQVTIVASITYCWYNNTTSQDDGITWKVWIWELGSIGQSLANGRARRSMGSHFGL